MNKDSWILVTGGAGLIGSAIVYELNQRGYRNIVIVDHLDTGEKWQNLRALDFVDYYEKDDFFRLYVTDKDLDKRSKGLVGGIAIVALAIAGLASYDWNPVSME